MLNDERHAEALDAFWTGLATNRATPPDEVNVALAEIVQRLVHALGAPPPDPAFVARLKHRLIAHTPEKSSTPNFSIRQFRWARPQSRQWALPALTAAALALITVIAVLGPTRHPVSAQEILRRARTVVLTGVTSDIRTMSLTETIEIRPGESGLPAFAAYPGTIQSNVSLSFSKPSLWKINRAYSTPSPSQLIQDSFGTPSEEVSDGVDVWDYDIGAGSATVHRLYPGQGRLPDLIPFGATQDGNAQPSLLGASDRCYSARSDGTNVVAGRYAYVIDLGPTRCTSGSAHQLDGRRVIWVDKQTSLILKLVLYSVSNPNSPYITATVNRVQYGLNLSPALFKFTLPSGAILVDYRPKPLPTITQYADQLKHLAINSLFPLYAPPAPPPGLVPELPDRDVVGGVEMAYIPPTNTSALSDDLATAADTGVYIEERKAVAGDRIEQGSSNTSSVHIGSLEGWTNPAIVESNGTGRGTAVSFIRGGTFIRVSSQLLSEGDTLRLASGLVAVQGSHAALRTVRPPTLSALRHGSSYPILVPGWTPPGFTSRPPSEGSGGLPVVTIVYRSPTGATLTVVNGPAGCCLAANPRNWGTIVRLPQGKAHIMQSSPRYGGSVVWWERRGSYVSIIGTRVTTRDLLKTAESMSRSESPR